MFLERLKNYKLILASNSSRRQQFLNDLNLNYEIRLKDVEEIYPQNLKGSQITDFLVKLKAKFFDLSENEILISSDTIVWLDEEVLGKPKNHDQAFAILKKLSGRTHQVITSVCFKSIEKTKTFNATTKVTFSDLTYDMIHFYINQYQPFDKAGSYGIQEWIGLIGIEKIEGSYTNVVGLPTEIFFKELIAFIET